MGTDASDWAKAVAGSGEAFGRIFDRHRDRVARHSARLVPTSADAEDVVALTFMGAWRKRGSVRFVDESLLPWLLVTATYSAQNLSRATRRYRSLLARLPPSSPAADHADSVNDEATQQLRSLSLVDRQVIVLSVLEGLSEREVALALDVPIGTVKSRLSRAKARLARRVTQSRAASVLEGGKQ